MVIKRRLETKDIFSSICEFAENEVTIDEYSKSDTPENEMQKHFSEFVSHHYDVLREVNIPAKKEIDGCGKDNWEIDETLYIQGTNGMTFYITGELKLHTERMSDTRNYCDEVLADVERMKYISHEYSDVPMGFILFVTCDDEECQCVVNKIERLIDTNKVQIDYELKMNDNYNAIIVRIKPQNTEALYCYSHHWKARLNYLRNKGNIEEYYFSNK